MAIDGSADKCFHAALDALRGHGLKQTTTYSESPGMQAFLRSETYNVVVTATEISGDCTLWYLVGPDGLSFAG